MARERRSLWGSISTSNKVNNLSLKAALLYTWAIPHFDDEGFQEGTPKYLKTKVLPFREDITLEEIKMLEIEILLQKLWKIYHFNDTAYIQDPVFNERQSFHGISKQPSKIKELLIKYKTPESVFESTNSGVVVNQGRCVSKEKLSKEKRSKTNTGQNLKKFSFPFEERKKELKEQAKQLGVK